MLNFLNLRTWDYNSFGIKCDAFLFDDFTSEQLTSLKCATGGTEDTGAPTLPIGVNVGYRVAICSGSVIAIKEYDGSSWDIVSLIPIQLYH